MRFFSRAKTTLQSEFKVIDEQIHYSFYYMKGKDKRDLSFPFSDSEFRERYAWEGFEKYLAFEELYEAGYISQDHTLPVEKFYELLSMEDFNETLSLLDMPTELLEVSGDITIIGLPAKDPQFKLTLRDSRNKVLQQVAIVLNPFVSYSHAEQFVLPESIWKLYSAIENETYRSGYEMTAKVKKLAQEAGVTLDDFLQREEYHYIDTYDLVPELSDAATMDMKIQGQDETITDHLNAVTSKSTIRSPGLNRVRYETSPEVLKDIEVLKRKGPLKGAEIPQFFDNPKSIFPDHEFQIDLEQFSDRVKGFIEIKRPRMMQKEGKWGWFDTETGEELNYSSDDLVEAVKMNPGETFIPFQQSWVFVDKALRDSLNLQNEEDTIVKPTMALDILDNEESLDYSKEIDGKIRFTQFPIPSGLKADLYDHQKEGYNWICTMYQNKHGGLLADDMGLGKTIQVITFLLSLKEQNKLGSTLVVLPIALIDNWVDEINKFAPELFPLIHIHQGANRIKNSEELKKETLIFTSYDTLKIDQLVFGRIDFQSIITDEAQNIKSHNSQRSRAIRALKSEFRLGMTGTPVENSLEELWAIMDFVHPGSLRSLKDFKQRFIKEGNNDVLMDLLTPFYLRRTKEEVLKNKLPEKHLLPPIFVQASSIQMHLSQSMMSSVKSGHANVLNVLMHLRQLYAHPGVFEPVKNNLKPDAAPKLQEVIKLLNNIKKKNEKVLIFTEFRKVQSLLKQEISKKYGITVPIIDGSTQQRPEVVRQFNSTPGFGVMVLSPKAAGVGLTITSANHVIHYTRWWNPAVENQATDRAYRIGQKKEVYVYQIITRDPANFPNGTVEEIMDVMLAEKSELAQNVIIPFDTKSLQKKVFDAFQEG